jgi:hypothetical protein
MNTNHTPGPYWLSPLTQGGPEEHDLHINIISSPNILIADVYARLGTQPEICPAEAIANARLFVAAPLMYDALLSFPRAGQANLNSTATTEERSAYISKVINWANEVRLPILEHLKEVQP